MRTLILDVDGVLADFVYGFTRLANKLFGSPVYGTLHQRSWDKFDGLDRHQIAEVWAEVRESPDFWFSLPTLTKSEDFERINNFPGSVYFVTSRPGRDPKTQTEEWLIDCGVERPTVLVSSKKGEAASILSASAMLDDKAGNVIFSQYFAPKTIPYIIDRPYNKFDGEVIGSKVIRVATVGEFLDRVSGKVPV